MRAWHGWPGVAAGLAIIVVSLGMMLLASREERIALRVQLSCCEQKCSPMVVRRGGRYYRVRVILRGGDDLTVTAAGNTKKSARRSAMASLRRKGHDVVDGVVEGPTSSPPREDDP